jgi:hypothetical protein
MVGVMTTASDLLFSGGSDPDFFASNARTCELVSGMPLGRQVTSGPMSY